MKRFPQKPIRLDEKDLYTKLGEGNFIFVGSSTDMFAEDVPQEWIDRVFEVCVKYPDNTYLFQSKNPRRLCAPDVPFVFGTTIESNWPYPNSLAPDVAERAEYMHKYSKVGIRTMVTIEPIMDFDIDEMVEVIEYCNPEWVNVGADSGGNHLPEPSRRDIEKLIQRLSRFTEVKQKANLARIYGVS